MKHAKRKYVRQKITTDLIITKITQIRRKNNIAWMMLLKLAFKAKPRAAAKIMASIVENDRQVTKWMSRLGDK